MASVRRALSAVLALFIILVTLATGWVLGRLGIGRVVSPASMTELERQFAERMRDVTMVGTFTVSGRENRTPRTDRYAIVSTPQGPGIVWVSVWDSPVEAGEFFHIAGQAIEKRFGAKPAASANKSEQSYSAGDRAVRLTATEVQGRPAVIYVDVPRGANTSIVQPSQVTLAQ